MTDTQQRVAAKAFAKNWKDRGYEKGDSQIFWVELLTTVFGVTEISQFISFEDQVHLDHTSFIDGYIEKTHVMIEQKSINKSLTPFPDVLCRSHPDFRKAGFQLR